jgi:hypothetical protein
MMERAIGFSWSNGAEGSGRNARQLRNLEIYRAEFVQHPNDAVGFAAAYVQIFRAEFIPFLATPFV